MTVDKKHLTPDTTSFQDEEYSKNYPTRGNVLIGLGGTGNSAITRIKNLLNERIPEDSSASPVRFLGIDTDRAPADLSDSEFFSIDDSRPLAELINRKRMNTPPYLSWLNFKEIPFRIPNDYFGQGIRQFGRFFLMEKSDDLIFRLHKTLNDAIAPTPKNALNIHIFAGLCGGVGSGTFLDVCYMVKDFAAQRGCEARIYGYFFLPDLYRNCAHAGTYQQNMIITNGYAALQELDYFMRQTDENPPFCQEYRGFRKIEWKGAPVDRCHLIASPAGQNESVPDPYNLALSATTEYVLSTILQEHADSFYDSEKWLQQLLTANGKDGAACCYYTIGASRSWLPLESIQDYLNSRLIAEFNSPSDINPGQQAVIAFWKSIFYKEFESSSYEDVTKFPALLYEALKKRLDIQERPSFTSYQKDWKYVQEYGNAELMQHYKNQQTQYLSKQSEKLETAFNYIEELICAQLTAISTDIHMGPFYTYRLLVTPKHPNIPDILESLIELNRSSLDKLRKLYPNIMDDYQESYRNFESRTRRTLLDSDAKRVQDYEAALSRVMINELELELCTRLDQLLKKLYDYILKLKNSIFAPVRQTFARILETGRDEKVQCYHPDEEAPIFLPLIPFERLEPELDQVFSDIDLESVFSDLIQTLLAKQDYNSAIVDEFFSNFQASVLSKLSLDSLLEKYFGGDIVTRLVSNLDKDLYQPLHQKATPLFPHDDWVYESVVVAYPESSKHLAIAASELRNSIKDIRFYKNRHTGPISYVRVQGGLSLNSYSPLSRYKECYEEHKRQGCHLFKEFMEEDKFAEKEPANFRNRTDNSQSHKTDRITTTNQSHETDRKTNTNQPHETDRKTTANQPHETAPGTADRQTVPARQTAPGKLSFDPDYIIRKAEMDEKYIFISYAHKDTDIVLPILQKLAKDGYVIWYDEHITAASEWDDSIADHIVNSSYVISFISHNYMASDNCMDELKYARDEKKRPLLVFLDDVQLRGGLAMRLNRLQHIRRSNFTDDESFCQKLYEAEGISICKE